MKAQGLRVSVHAIIRFAQRVELQPWDDDVQVPKSERERIQDEIFGRIEGGRTLPTHCCLLFVKPGRGASDRNVQRALADGTVTSSSGLTAWGTYVYDGAACYVIQDNEVVTVIMPDDEQRRGLEDLLEHLANAPDDDPPPSSPLAVDGQSAQLLCRALQINESFGELGLPDPVAIEIYYPADILEDELVQKPSFVAGFLRWIGRVVPARGKRVLLILDPHFRFFTTVTDLLADGGLETVFLPRGFDQHSLSELGEKAPGYAFVRKALNGQVQEYAHTFILCTRKTVSAVLGVARRHTASFEALVHYEYVKGTVYALDLAKPQRERLTTFYV